MTPHHQAVVLYVLQWFNVALLVATFAAPVFFVSMYSLSSWRGSMLGRATMFVWVDMMLILALSLANRLIAGVEFNPPPIDQRLWVRVVLSFFVFGTLTCTLWWKAWVAWMVQNRPQEVIRRDREYRARNRIPEPALRQEEAADR